MLLNTPFYHLQKSTNSKFPERDASLSRNLEFIHRWMGVRLGIWCLVKMAQPYWQPSGSARETFQKLDYFKSWGGWRLKIFTPDSSYCPFTHFTYIWSKSRKSSLADVAYSPGHSLGPRKRIQGNVFLKPTWIVEVDSASPVNPQLGSHRVCHRPRHHVQHLIFHLLLYEFFQHAPSFDTPYPFSKNKASICSDNIFVDKLVNWMALNWNWTDAKSVMTSYLSSTLNFLFRKGFASNHRHHQHH